MSENGKGKVEIEKYELDEKTNLLAYGKFEAEDRNAAQQHEHDCDQHRGLLGCSLRGLVEGTYNNERNAGSAPRARREANGNGEWAGLSSSTSFDAAAIAPYTSLNNYGAIRKSESKEADIRTHQHLLPTRRRHTTTTTMDEHQRYRRYSAVSAPVVVSLLSSIADQDENRIDHQPIPPPSPRLPVVRFEEMPKTTSTSVVATSTSGTDSTKTKKSVDELRRVLEKRWDQLTRHRLVILQVVLVAYVSAFLVAYLCAFQGSTRLAVVLILCSVIVYCSILVLLCITCPAISARPIFLSLSSVCTATLWPVIIWVLTLCCSQDDFRFPGYGDHHDNHQHETINSSWTLSGLPPFILFLFALYEMLAFPKYIDTIWGVITSILHVVLTYVNRGGDEERNARQIWGTILILVTANAFGLFISLCLRRSREFMWRQFDDSIEKRATVEYEKERQEQLLLSIIPAYLAARVRKTILNRASKTRESIDTSADQPRLFHDLHVQQHENVSILFADIVNFTPLTTELTAPQLVRFLNELYSRFDEIAQEFQCMRIKILGDCYYCVSGMPVSRPNHADNCVKMALAMIDAIKSLREAAGIKMDMRIGVHSGSVLCGILGLKKWQYDIWSDDVTIANHMEQGGRPGSVHITKETLQLLSGDYRIIPATTNDAYILSQRLETYFILPYSATTGSDADCGTTPSVEDIFGTVNGLSMAPPLGGRHHHAQRNGGGGGGDDGSEEDQKQRRMQSKKEKLNVFTPSSNRTFDRYKSFSFRQYHGTTDLSDAGGRGKRQLQRPASPMIRKNTPSCESFASTQYRQTGKMSKIIEFWGGADTPFSNLSRRRSSDHVRAASITAIENNYVQYRWSQVLSASSNCWTSPTIESSTTCCSRCCDKNRRDGSSGANLLLDCMLHYSDGSIGESFYKNSEPIPYPAWTTAAVVVTLSIGIIGSTCVLPKYDLAVSIIFGAILLFLALWSVFQWSRTKGKKMNYANVFLSAENYDSFYKRVVPTMALILSMALPVTLLSVRTQSENWSAFGHYDVCLFQLTVMLVVCNCRPRFFNRCCVVLGCFVVFVPLLCYISETRESSSSEGAFTNNARNESNTTYKNVTGQSNGLIALSFEYHAVLEIVGLILLVIATSWLIEYESKVDWLCVTSFRVEQEDVETMQDINMILLHNILPAHVAAHFLRPERPPEDLYHENHPYVCVMFASIPNFKDFWSQWDFSRQLECLRLLNEIVCEFDKLLAKPKYSNVEKIKTVGSTYMAVCGLHSNPTLQLDPRRYVCIMVEFAFAIMTLLEQLNRDAFQNFQLRIGMSFGPVISGVIGAQKPLYDIWSHTVNVASRMDTHGAMGKIHVTQETAAALQACGYEVESRGLVKIKGIKNEVETYFVRPPSDRRSVAY